MLRSRASTAKQVDTEDEPLDVRSRHGSRKRRKIRKRSLLIDFGLFLIVLMMTVAAARFRFSHYSEKFAHEHTVETKHLRKSVFHEGAIDAPQQDDVVPKDSIFSLQYPSMKQKGELFELSTYAGRVALEGDHLDELVILAFPTNDFRQEQGTNEEIEEKVKGFLGDQYYNPNFMLFHKSKLHHNPVYQSLQKHLPDHRVNHNFFKYLIGRDGVPVGFYSKKETLFDMEAAIIDELQSV